MDRTQGAAERMHDSRRTHRHTRTCMRTNDTRTVPVEFLDPTAAAASAPPSMQSESCLNTKLLVASSRRLCQTHSTAPLASTSLLPVPQPSATMDELTEKMSEARGMLSNLIFGKKQKKPRELVRPSTMNTRDRAGLRPSRSIGLHSTHRVRAVGCCSCRCCCSLL